MKKLVISALVIVSIIAVTGCCNSNKNGNDIKAEQAKDINMAKQKTTSGLEYEVIKEGTGETPKKGQKVTVHYTGWLDKNGEPGTKFDSSVDRGEPFVFTIGVGQVIKGWDEGVMLMKVGEKRRLIIPAALGYGDSGAGRIIPPRATLIFDVDLIKIG